MSVDFDHTRRRLIGAATFTALLSLTRVGHAAGARQIVAVRVWPSSTYTRITLESPEPLRFKHFTMKDPERLVVDIDGVQLNSALKSLDGKVGDYVAVARQAPAAKGGLWYIGAMTDWTMRELRIKTDFLPAGEYELETFQDGLNADRCAQDYKRSVTRIKSGDTLRAPMAPGKGGRSKPSRVWPQREQVTSAIHRLRDALVRAHARVLHLGEAEERQELDVHPADVELEPAVRELRAVRIGVMVVMPAFTVRKDTDEDIVSAVFVGLIVPVAPQMGDGIHRPGLVPDEHGAHEHAPDQNAEPELQGLHCRAAHRQFGEEAEAEKHHPLHEDDLELKPVAFERDIERIAQDVLGVDGHEGRRAAEEDGETLIADLTEIGQRFVLDAVLPARTGAGNRPHGDLALLQPRENLRRGAHQGKGLTGQRAALHQKQIR